MPAAQQRRRGVSRRWGRVVDVDELIKDGTREFVPHSKRNVTMWRYYLRGADPHPPFGWAEIVLVSTGMFAAVSDYGNYAFAWRAFGNDIRVFLLGVEDDYFVSKIAPQREYDGDATCLNVKRAICELRRERRGDFAISAARKEWDLLEEHGDLDTREDFALWYNETDLHEVVMDVHELCVYRRDPQAVAFADRVLPLLKEAIVAEIAAEREADRVG